MLTAIDRQGLSYTLAALNLGHVIFSRPFNIIFRIHKYYRLFHVVSAMKVMVLINAAV